RDAVEPGAQCRAALEAVEVPPRAQERVLDGVLRVERRAEHPVAVRGQLAAMLLQLAEGGCDRERRALHDGHPRPGRPGSPACSRTRSTCRPSTPSEPPV